VLEGPPLYSRLTRASHPFPAYIGPARSDIPHKSLHHITGILRYPTLPTDISHRPSSMSLNEYGEKNLEEVEEYETKYVDPESGQITYPYDQPGKVIDYAWALNTVLEQERLTKAASDNKDPICDLMELAHSPAAKDFPEDANTAVLDMVNRVWAPYGGTVSFTTSH
jgi:hypothetical protein